jgi:hypothetical protein
MDPAKPGTAPPLLAALWRDARGPPGADRERARGKASGVELERRWAVVFTVQMGKIVWFQAFKSRGEAVEAARPRP